MIVLNWTQLRHLKWNEEYECLAVSEIKTKSQETTFALFIVKARESLTLFCSTWILNIHICQYLNQLKELSSIRDHTMAMCKSVSEFKTLLFQKVFISIGFEILLEAEFVHDRCECSSYWECNALVCTN